MYFKIGKSPYFQHICKFIQIWWPWPVAISMLATLFIQVGLDFRKYLMASENAYNFLIRPAAVQLHGTIILLFSFYFLKNNNKNIYFFICLFLSLLCLWDSLFHPIYYF